MYWDIVGYEHVRYSNNNNDISKFQERRKETRLHLPGLRCGKVNPKAPSARRLPTCSITQLPAPQTALGTRPSCSFLRTAWRHPAAKSPGTWAPAPHCSPGARHTCQSWFRVCPPPHHRLQDRALGILGTHWWRSD